MYSSYSAAAFALRSAKPSLHAHSSCFYHPQSPLCHRDGADERRHRHYNELIPQSPYLAPHFFLDGFLLRHSAHLLLLSARLRPPPPAHPNPPRCCHRRAPIRCCRDGGSGRQLAAQISCRVEPRRCRCCGSGAGRPDLGAACLRLKAPECRCSSSGAGSLLEASCVRRDVLRLVRRAMRKEVWEYEGGQWPHRRCSTECHDDWEEEDEDCGYGRLDVAGRMHFSRRWDAAAAADDVDDDEDGRCRDCGRRKGLESYNSGEDVYSGSRRERRDLDEGRHNFKDSDQMRRQRRDYYDDEDDLDLRRRRHRWEGRNMRNFAFDDAVDKRNIESQEQVEVSIASASNTVVAGTSGNHLQIRIDDPFQSPSAVSIGSMKEQVDLAKVHASDATIVSPSQGPRTRNGNQVHSASIIHWSRERQGKNDQQITQVSSTEHNHNMDLIWQQADTSRISDDKNITSLPVESTEEGSSKTDLDMAQQAATMGSYEQEVRSETTAGSSVPSGLRARQTVKESMLESAARLEKLSTFLVGRFVDELQKEVLDADTTTKKNEKSIVEGASATSSLSRSRTKGPADEMWDVQSTTSQETFKTANKEEGSSADGATNSASQTPKNESALARKAHKALWAYVADIIRLGWIQCADSHDSSHKSVKKSSSNNFQSTEGWLSSQERDNDGTKKKNGSTKAQDQQLIKLHGGEPESGAASMSKEEYLHTGTHGLQISETVVGPEVGRSERDLLSRSSMDDVHLSGERIKQYDVAELPKVNSIDDSTSSLLDIAIGHISEHKSATSRITTKGSGEFNTQKGMLAGSSSVATSAMEAGRSGDGADWIYDPSGAITPYHDPQMQAVMPHENTTTVGGSASFEEKNVVQVVPEVIKTGGKDVELKRRMFQRNKQVMKGTFDEWEEAYQRDAEQRKLDELFMREALLEAQRAADIWEVPVGAVLVQNGEIIARGYNLVEDLRDSTAHAEIVCIREASNKLKTWRLSVVPWGRTNKHSRFSQPEQGHRPCPSFPPEDNHQAWCAVGRVLRDNAAVLPTEEKEEATVTTPGPPPWPPPSCQVLQQDAPHVRHDLLFVVCRLMVCMGM